MRAFICVVTILVCAPMAWGQAITGFVGGSEYDSYYGSLNGDVVGYRFTVTTALNISSLGVWNNDSNGDGPGLTASHQVGVWDGSQALLASATVDPSGIVVGDWIYTDITPVTLNPGETYTIGAMYLSGDLDSYISSASSMTTVPEITFGGAVYPFEGELGFVYPTEDSGPTSYGRFGPNFLITDIPVTLMTFTTE
ncbi:MAG: DUF4082 domain-containing protein [Acidobacteriota bacterium]